LDHPVDRNLVETIDHGGGLSRGYTFVTGDGREQFFSFDALRGEAARRAGILRGLGLKKGDRLAMVVPDGVDFVPSFLAATWAGVVPVPLYPPLAMGKLDSYLDSLTRILRRAEPAYLCTTARLRHVLWSVVPKVPSLRGVVTTEELMGEGGGDERPVRCAPEDPVFLQFTSGSTSAPKGVVVSHANLQANCWSVMREGLDSDSEADVGVSWLPLYHDMGLIGFVIAPLFHKVPVVFLPTMSFVRNANLWLDTMSRKKGTITFAPNFAYALAAKRARPEQIAAWDLSHVKAFGCGAEPINVRTLETFLHTFRPAGVKPSAILPCYGMAEATLAISFVGLDEPVKTDRVDRHRYEAVGVAEADPDGAMEVVSCGRPFAGHEMAVFGADGTRLGERQVGELALRGPSVTQGYFRDPAGTEAAYDGGWLRTGDLGYLAEGEVYITGRKKDVIIFNGRNYDPQRIEWLVDDLPGVRRGSAVAFSRPGTSSEELVVAVEARSGDRAALTLAIQARVNEQLQLVVADVVLVSPGALPKTSSGKLQRQRTREQYLAGTLGREGVRTLGGTAQRLSLAKHLTLSLVGRGRHAARRLIRRPGRAEGPP